MEWCYILGDFGVYNAGRYNIITKLPEKLGFTDITKQFLPFYSGKLTYHVPVTTDAEQVRVRIPQYRAAAVLVGANDGERKQVSLAPFTAVLNTQKGENTIHTVGSVLNGEYGIQDGATNVPTIIGADGVEKVLELDLDPQELRFLQASAESVKKILAEVKDI